MCRNGCHWLSATTGFCAIKRTAALAKRGSLASETPGKARGTRSWPPEKARCAMTRDFSGESRTTQVDFDEFVKKAEAESQGLTKACCQFLRAWYWARTEEAAKKQSELTKSIGKRRVDELKEEVRALQKQ